MLHGVLPLALAAAFPSSSWADAEARHLPETVVTATRLPQPVQDVVADVSVVTQEELRRSGQTTLREVLQRLPGVQMSSNGSYASNTQLFMRGAELSRMVVLLDGIRIGSATSGAAAIENIPVAQIERIEVLRGPATTLYGADAVGGVIQIFTRRGSAGQQYEAQAGFGSHGLVKSSGSVSGGGPGWGYALSLSGERAKGISSRTREGGSLDYNPDDDSYRSGSVAGSLNWTVAPGHTISTQWFSARNIHEFDSTYSDPLTFGSPLGLTSATTDAETRGTTTNWGVTIDNRLSERWQSSVRLGLTLDKSASVYERASDGARDGRYDFDTERLQFGWQNTFSIGSDKVIAALERVEDEVDSTTPYTVSRRHTNSALLAYSLDRGPWIGQAAVRRDHNSQFGGFTTGSLSLGYRLTPALRLTGSAANNFQAPTFNQLYFPDYGNPALRPQRNQGRELGVKYDDGRWQGSLTFYRNHIRGFIDTVTAKQTSRAKMSGATLQAGWRNADWHIDGSFDILDAKDEATDRELVRRADRTAQLTVEKQAAWGNAFVEWLLVSDREDTAVKGRRPRLGGYGLLNLGAQWRLAPAWTLLARLNNATDKDYTTAYSYSTLGRTAFIGIQFSGSRP